ncbi:hypothetical protein DICPUDRAFT_56782 [Dictyostelium purpureum]|uniref:Uncharacterized protein n=1 Tax=Dictyostelium purpureum TaxID=5786 RepID=F0ZT29_DICPU|nr:uncharacterized protein DICPUDRAFT_56782 [Dictyostelium purpureum]EGC32887.1 hypothetical protein DICPUDRAFT_56782 [Dictyostelium purpureum]|eukprot:XP_003290572.1 hypothetical protein DICPUDRAFT_56782 [Dictyostelium purpureum]
MKYIKLLKNYLFPLWNKPVSEIKRNVYFSLFFSANITLSILFLVIDVFRNFFTIYFAVFNTLFLGVSIINSESFYILIKNQFRVLLAIFIGLVVGFVSFQITFNHVWTSVFITLVFVYISSAIMVTGSNVLPYNLGKVMYLPYFNLVYFNRPDDRSIIPFLKFLLTGVSPIILVIVVGLIFRMDFSSNYYIQCCRQNLKTSRKLICTIERELEIKTLESINYPLDSSYQRNIVKSITNRIEADYNGSLKDHSQGSPLKLRKKLGVPIYLKPRKQEPIHLSPLSDVVNHDRDDESTCSMMSEFTTTSKDKKISNQPEYVKENVKDSTKFKNNGSLEGGEDIVNHYYNFKKSLLKNPKHQNDTHNYFKISLEKLNVENSRNLNQMEKYLLEAKKEFWNKDMFGYFNEISYLLETNHKKLLTINMAFFENITVEKSRTLLVILPFLNTLINQTSRIFRIMHKQIGLKYKPVDITPEIEISGNELFTTIDMENIIEYNLTKGIDYLKSTESLQRFKDLKKHKTLEYSQYKILMCFDYIERTIKDINNQLEEIYDPETSFGIENIDEETRVNFLVSAFKKFSKDQKILSSTVFMLSFKLWGKSKESQHITMFKSIFKKWYIWVTTWNKRRKERNELYRIDYNEFPHIIHPHYTLKEKAQKLWGLVSFRLFSKWVYSLQLALGVSIFSIVYYELKIHESFILFRNLAWAVITYCLVSAPSIGAIAYFSILRITGAVFGSILGYTAAVIYSTTNNDVARAFIFAASTFLCSFFGSIYTRAQMFEKLVLFFILSFVIIAFLAYPNNSPSIITSLFRMMHILVGVGLVYIISITVSPYYDHRQLKNNLYLFPFKVSQSFNFLICNTLLDPTIVPLETRQVFYQPSKYNYIQQHLPNEMNQKMFRSTMNKQLNLLRYQIPIQRVLLYYSRYELFPLRKKKYYQLRRLLFTETKMFHALLSLEFIIVSALPKKHLNEISKVISLNLLRLMSEIDNVTKGFMNIPDTEKGERFITENQTKVICNEIARDIGEYIYKNRYDRESLNLLRYCSAIIFCLISFVDLFDLVFDKVVAISHTSVYKRTESLNKKDDISKFDEALESLENEHKESIQEEENNIISDFEIQKDFDVSLRDNLGDNREFEEIIQEQNEVGNEIQKLGTPIQ